MHRNAYILLALTTLFWACNAIAGKLAIGEISPMLLTALRWAIACAILLAIGWRRFAGDWPVVKKHLLLLFALGAAGFTFFNAALYSALEYTSAINVSIEQAAMPMVIMALNFLFFRINVTASQIVGFVLSVIGIAIVASHGELSRLAALDVNFGDALMILAVVTYSAYTVALRYRPAIHWQSLMITLCFAAFLATLPFLLWEQAAGNLVAPTSTGWMIVAFTAIFPSILSQIFYIRGVELIGPNRAGLFINLVPIYGTGLSILILGEAFHLYHLLALALVLGGIALAEAGSRRHQAVRPPQPR